MLPQMDEDMEATNWLQKLLMFLDGGDEPPHWKGGFVRIPKEQSGQFWNLLCGVLTHKKRRNGLELMLDKGFLACVFLEVARLVGVLQPEAFHPEGDAFRHTILTVANLKNPTCAQAVAALLHDVAKPLTFAITDRIRFNRHNAFGVEMIRSLARRLLMPPHITELATFVCKNHMLLLGVRKMRLPRLARLFSSPHFESLLKVWEADIAASHGDIEDLCYVRKVARILRRIPAPKRWFHPLSVAAARKLGLSADEAVRAVREIDLLALQGRVKTKQEAINHILRHRK
ncbi:MAG: hypothetical protein DRP63_09050 [Planctomycetota bacterium]|nr:MAG: hypothetical protein DRP63_09050 [Planctomycetota bacterium]